LAIDATTTVNEQAAAELGERLRALGYSEAAITALLGEDGYSTGPEDLPTHARRLPDSELATAVKLLFLGMSIENGAIVRALGRDGLDALEATGLAEVGELVVPQARIVPVEDLLIAADSYSRGIEDPTDYVAAFSPTSRLCDALTVRRPIDSALDVGTGSGAQALLAARHSRRVVATDVNPRALAFTRLNAALNGLDNIEVRSGSLFEPAQGERFDLVVCNAPYVISPERRWTYRDAGGVGDEVSERVVRDAAAHLADGGFATVTASWVAEDPDDPDERVLAWVEGTGCDAWIFVAWEADVLDHAAEWNAELAGDPESFAERLDEWRAYLEDLGVRWVSEGAVVLHRTSGAVHTTRIDMVDQDELEAAPDQIERAFAARARLAELARASDLLDERLWVASRLRLEQELEPHEGTPAVRAASVTLDEGTYSTVEADPDALEVVFELDPELTLAEVLDEVAERLDLDDVDAQDLQRATLELCRELLELGALQLV
jgi:methylase of polypeptide subunit release factors